MAEGRYSRHLKVTGKRTGKVTRKAVGKVTGMVVSRRARDVPPYPPVPLAGVTGGRDSRTGPDGGEFTGTTPGISLSRSVRGAGAVAGPECVRNPGRPVRGT